MQSARRKLAIARPEKALRLRTAADAVRLFGDDLRTASDELLRIAHLDHDEALLALVEQSGGHDALPIAMGEIIRDACAHGTRRMVIAHNHPSGDATPSRADRWITRKLSGVLYVLDIELVDHLIFSGRTITSFRALGFI